MTCRLLHELSRDGIDVAVACRVLHLSRSTYYDWCSRPPSLRDVDDAHLLQEIREVHAASRATYGAPRVHAELKLGRGHRIGKKRVARLMRIAGLQGVCHRRKGRHRPAPAVHDDLVRRRFTAIAPDQLWCTDVTEHPTREGRVYCCAVLDVFSRRIVGGVCCRSS
ncbi:MAG TPA: IS3 family transposase [Acidimicrobiales bacterium]|nr:IS3 family transposase [Acidimicrobiales bacterium]